MTNINIAIKICFLLLVTAWMNTSIFGQVTKEQLLKTISEGEDFRATVRLLNSMSPDERKKGVGEVTELIHDLSAASRANPTGERFQLLQLIKILPWVADDATVANSLSQCLNNQDEMVVKGAASSMAESHGPMSERILSSQIEQSYAYIAGHVNVSPADKDTAQKVELHGAVFFWCLVGLLQGESTSAHEVGTKYLSLFHGLCDRSIEGRRGYVEMEKELRQNGVVLSGTNATANTTALVPRLTVSAAPANASPAPSTSPQQSESEHSALSTVWLVTGALILAAGGLFALRKFGRSSVRRR